MSDPLPDDDKTGGANHAPRLGAPTPKSETSARILANMTSKAPVPPARTNTARVTATEIVALILSLIWLGMVGLFYAALGPGEDGSLMSMIMSLVGIFLPIAMIWIAAVTARTTREMRAEARQLQHAIEAMRQAWLQSQTSLGRPSVERKLEEIALATRQTESTLATFASRREAAAAQPSADRKAALTTPRPSSAEDQPSLALGTPAEDMRAPVSVADFIRALNFPDNGEDREGFRALRRALEDRAMAKLIRAAQGVLTLMSQDGIYMDDLKFDRARPEIWRRFALGERGREIAPLGGVRDRSSLTLAVGRMRQDTVFRDAVHHFLREFDKTFAEFNKNASDADVVDLAETRTARAFMLLGRINGIFD